MTFIRAVLDEKNEELLQILRNGLCKCGKPGLDMHSCPYDADINGDITPKCNCCERCSTECGNDI